MEDLQLLCQQPQQQRHTAAGLLDFQDALFVFIAHLHVLGHIVGELSGLLGGHHVHDHVAGHLRGQGGVFHEQLLGVADHSQITLGDPGDLHIGEQFDIGSQIRFFVHQTVHEGALFALHQNTDAVAGDLENLPHLAIGAQTVQIILTGIVHRHIPLGHQKDPLAVGHGVLHGADGLLPAHIEVEQCAGKNGDSPQRKGGNLVDDFVDSGCCFHWVPPVERYDRAFLL